LLQRTNPYNQEGRYQSEAEALEIDDGVERMLRHLKIPGVVHCKSTEEDLRNIWENVIKKGG